MGGKEKVTERMKAESKRMSDQGVVIKSCKVGEPGEFVSGGGQTFVVVPTNIEMSAPGVKATVKSYVLGLSPDGGKSWSFIDGNGLRNEAARKELLPNLPEKLKLPAP